MNPLPDDFYYDHHKQLVAVELKSRKSGYREIATGIGQCILSLNMPSITAAYLVLPQGWVSDTLKSAVRVCPYLGILSYGSRGRITIELEPQGYLKRADLDTARIEDAKTNG